MHQPKIAKRNLMVIKLYRRHGWSWFLAGDYFVILTTSEKREGAVKHECERQYFVSSLIGSFTTSQFP